MRVLILSRKRTLYTTRRLVEEVVALGHQPIVARATAVFGIAAPAPAAGPCVY